MTVAPRPLSEALRADPRLRVEAFDNTVLAPIVERAFARAETLPAVTEEAVQSASAAKRAAIGFEASLKRPGRRFILEVKSASPSLGLIAKEIDLTRYAAVYNRFADAVSVLTEPDFFGGSFARLAALRTLTEKPLLAKDFIVDCRQILAARQAGADAVLLMLSVLSAEGYRSLAAFAAKLGLDVLTEVSDEAEAADAAALGARIIGINNRNLRDLSINLGRTAALASSVPADRLLVSESGIRTHADIEKLAPHASAFLIGSVLGAAADLSLAVRTLIFGETKCCGITRTEDALCAARAGAASIGIISVPRSPRFLAPAAAEALARDIARTLGENGLSAHLTLVADAGDEKALLALQGGAFDGLQLHGDVDEALLQTLRTRFPGLRIHAAFGFTELTPDEETAEIARIESLLRKGFLDRALLDGALGGLTGGTGRTPSFTLPARFSMPERILLAGGLCPENAAPAARSGAAGLDFNSGIESAPGIKCAARINALFSALRAFPDNYSHEVRHAS